MFIGKLFSGFWTVVLGLALIAWLAGVVVMTAVAGNGGNALGQGIKGGFTFVGAVGSGFTDAKAVEDQVKAADAEKRARAAEKRARAAEKRAAAKGKKP
jgi:hypothetical protein